MNNKSTIADRLRSLYDTEEIPILDQDWNTPKPKKRRRRRKRRGAPAGAIIGVLLSILVAAGISAMYIYRNVIGENLTLLDRTAIRCSGYDGSGSVSEDFHPETAAIETLEQKAASLEAKGKDASDLRTLADSIVCGFDSSSGLSNGDTITYACQYDAAAAKAAHYRFSSVQKSYKVEGLSELSVLDPFEGVSAEWVLNDAGTSVTFRVPELQQNLGITYRWSYGTENGTYNGSTIHAEADYNSSILAASGYVIEKDTKEIEMGALPEIITSIDDLSAQEKEELIAQMESVLDTELAACGNQYSLKGELLTVSSYSSGYLSQDCDTAWYEPDTAFTISFDLKLDTSHSTGSWLSGFYTYTVSYSGTIYRLSDGTVQFNNETNHACYFAGYIGIYHIAEEDESSEIFGNLFNDVQQGIQDGAEAVTDQAQNYTEIFEDTFSSNPEIPEETDHESREEISQPHN